MGPTKSSLFGEIEMLAPESHVTEKVLSFFKAFLNLAGACKAMRKQAGAKPKRGDSLQSGCSLQSSAEAAVTWAV